MKVLKGIRNILIVILILGWVTAGYDYYRISVGDQPVFCIKNYDKKNKLESYRGLYYIVERTLKENRDERFDLSRKVVYRFLTIRKEVTYTKEKSYEEYIILVKEKECNSSYLYSELSDSKVYLDCIDEINIKYKNDNKSKSLKDEINEEFINNLLNKLSYVGLSSDGTMIFKNLDDSFISKNVTIYKCMNNTKDIYITLNNKMEDDYCIIKNDSIKQED